MKSFGRLLMAAALIVPLGVATAQSAGAAAKTNVTCTTNTGTLTANPGISLTTARGTAFSGKGGVLDSCTGIGIADTTSATLSFALQKGAASCRTIKGKTYTGQAKIVWGTGSNNGVVTKASIRITFTGIASIKFGGVVSGGGYLGGDQIKATATLPGDLKPAGAGAGKCGNSGSSRVKSLDYTNATDFTIGV
jgi:hypothetical protein